MILPLPHMTAEYLFLFIMEQYAWPVPRHCLNKYIGVLLIGPLGTKLNEILIEIHARNASKMSNGKWRPFCRAINVLIKISPNDFTAYHPNVISMRYEFLWSLGCSRNNCCIYGFACIIFVYSAIINIYTYYQQRNTCFDFNFLNAVGIN